MITDIKNLAEYAGWITGGSAALVALWKGHRKLTRVSVEAEFKEEMARNVNSANEITALKTAVQTLEESMCKVDDVLSKLSEVHSDVRNLKSEVVETKTLVEEIRTETIPSLNRAIGRLEGAQKPTYDRRSSG